MHRKCTQGRCLLALLLAALVAGASTRPTLERRINNAFRQLKQVSHGATVHLPGCKALHQ